MQRRHLFGQRLTAVFLLGCVLFNYPLLAVFQQAGLWGDIPAVFAWLMAAWSGLIVLMALIVERAGPRDD